MEKEEKKMVNEKDDKDEKQKTKGLHFIPSYFPSFFFFVERFLVSTPTYQT